MTLYSHTINKYKYGESELNIEAISISNVYFILEHRVHMKSIVSIKNNVSESTLQTNAIIKF